MTETVQRRLGASVRIVGMLVLLGWFASRIDVTAVGAALAGPDAAPWFAAAFLAYAVGQVTNGLAWRGLLHAAGGRVTFGEMIRHDLSSVFWSTVLPGGVAGEVVKGVRLAREADPGSVAVSILAARLVSGTTSCLLALGCLPWAGIPTGYATVGAAALVAVIGIGGAGLVALRLGTRLRTWPLPAVLKPWVARVPVGAFPAAGALAMCGAFTLVTHVAFAGVYLCCFGAAGAAISLPAAAVLCALTSVAQLAPITVGGFGVRELTIAGLGATLVDAERANAAALALGVTFTVVAGVGGVVELGRKRRVSDAGTQASPPSPRP